MSKVAFLFPGQASQKVGMGHNLYTNYASARTVFKSAEETFNSDLCNMMFCGSQHDLNSTVNAQPAIAAVSIAAWQAMEEAAEFIQLPAMVAGHSLGEYSALAVANSLSVKDTLKLVTERGRLMERACDENPGGMAALIGIGVDIVKDICRETATHVSNINSATQIIISGHKENLAQAIDLAGSRGARRVVPLTVGGAFHSQLMAPVQDELNDFIETLDFQDPLVPIIANSSAEPLYKAREVKEELKVQLLSCVRWSDSVEYMARSGVNKFVEIGPGRVLSGLVKRLVPDATVINVEDFGTVQSYLNSN